MAYTPTLVEDSHGTISRVRGEGETHTLTATVTDPDYVFDHWEQSVNDGETWTTIQNDGETVKSTTIEVTLTADTSYRFICTPVALTGLEITAYSLASTGDSWTTKVNTTVDLPVTKNCTVTYNLYEGETESEGELLGTATANISAGKQSLSGTSLSWSKRPTDSVGKVLLVASLPNGSRFQTSYNLKGTLDLTAPESIQATQETFLKDRDKATFQVEASAYPSAEITYGGGDTNQSSRGWAMINSDTGLVTYIRMTGSYSTSRTFTASTDDGREASCKVFFYSYPAIKLDNNIVYLKKGEELVVTPTMTNASITVDSQNVSVASSDGAIV